MRTTLVATTLLVLVTAAATSAQTLGLLAQREAARRQTIASPARILTVGDLVPTVPARFPPPTVPDSNSSAAEPLARRIAVAPAALRSGALPGIPPMAVSGGEVVLEVVVDKTGRAVDIKTLRDTPPFTSELIAVARAWQFQPAEDAEAPAPGKPIDRTTRRFIDSSVLVIGLFRPPALFPTTLGEPPRTVAAPSNAVPIPVTPTIMPTYPPQALFDGVVLTELRIDANGRVADTRVLRSSPGLDEPTLDAVRRLAFQPARVHGSPAPAMVYVVTAFRQPIIQ